MTYLPPPLLRSKSSTLFLLECRALRSTHGRFRETLPLSKPFRRVPVLPALPPAFQQTPSSVLQPRGSVCQGLLSPGIDICTGFFPFVSCCITVTDLPLPGKNLSPHTNPQPYCRGDPWGRFLNLSQTPFCSPPSTFHCTNCNLLSTKSRGKLLKFPLLTFANSLLSLYSGRSQVKPVEVSFPRDGN